MKTEYMMEMLAGYAGEYHEDAVGSIKRNKHTSDLTEKDFEGLDDKLLKKIADATTIDFVNFIAAKLHMNLGLCTKDLPGEAEKRRKRIQDKRGTPVQLIKASEVIKGDVIEGPDGSSEVIDIIYDKTTIKFDFKEDDHCWAGVVPNEKIALYKHNNI